MRIDPAYKIESATRESLPVVVRITEASGLSEWTLSDYTAELERDDSIFRVAVDGSKSVVGFVVGRVIPSSSSGSQMEAEIYNIGIVSELKREGIGSALMLAFIERAKLVSVSAVWLEVRSTNSAAITFYEYVGFEAVGDRRHYYTNPVDDAIIMRSSL